MTHLFAAYKIDTLRIRTYTDKKWRNKKDISCKWKPKESSNVYTFIRRSEVKSLSRVRLFVTPWTVAYHTPGISHGIFQARVLEWVAISFSRGSSRPRNWTLVSRIVGRCFTIWATREVDLKTKTVVLTDKRGCYIMIKGPIQEESVTFVTVENFNTPLPSVGRSLRQKNK